MLSDLFFREKFDYRAKWFGQLSFEEKLYRKIKVKKWKKKLPTYSPHDFSMKMDSAPRVLRATCQAEAVHEAVMVLSFVPVILCVWLGSFWFFMATSIIMFLFDGIFVIAQRYNRPRLIRLLEKQTDE